MQSLIFLFRGFDDLLERLRAKLREDLYLGRLPLRLLIDPCLGKLHLCLAIGLCGLLLSSKNDMGVQRRSTLF